LTITSNSYGSTSSVSIANGTAKTNLLGANPTTTSTAGQLNGTQPGSYAVTVTTLPTQGKAVGSVTASTTIADGATLAVTLGDTSATVALTAGSYTASTLAAHIQSAINGNSTLIAAGKTVNVSQSTGVLTITSANYGSTSTVNLTGGTAKTDLFGTTTTATSGVDASGTINGVAAIGSGQFLTGVTGNASEGLKIQVVGGLTGSRGTVDYSQGYAYKLNKLMDSFLNTTGSIASRTDGINKSIADISLQRTAMTRRLATTEALYRKQFTSLDTLVASLNSTGTSLTSMLKGLPSSSYTQSSTN
jgi:flagellar hook-associated protein 2